MLMSLKLAQLRVSPSTSVISALLSHLQRGLRRFSTMLGCGAAPEFAVAGSELGTVPNAARPPADKVSACCNACRYAVLSFLSCSIFAYADPDQLRAETRPRHQYK